MSKGDTKQNKTPAEANNTPLDLSSTNFVVGSDVTMEAALPANGTAHDDETINEYSLQQHTEHGSAAGTTSSTDNVPTQRSGEKYKLHSEIARGGMGVVLEAQDNSLERDVAMKVMINPREASRQRVLRFIEEARITSQLQHPGIMPIYELGTDRNGNVFYTMKRVTGRTLKEILKDLKEGKKETEAEYPLSRLLNILQRVCDAVAYAHSKGVIHRDLKPDNIMIGDYGEVLVLDWGLAKRMTQHGRTSSNDGTSTPGVKVSGDLHGILQSVSSDTKETDSPLVTMEGNAIGTPGYMAPEQARGQVGRMDEKSDIYSLGAILYHILALEPMVRCDKTTRKQELLEKISSGRIEPLKESKRAPKSLIVITMKALSLRPKDRYRTVKAFQSDLDAHLGGFATSAEEWNVAKLAKLFMLRHKVVSFFSMTMLGLLVTGLSINYMERLKAEKAGNTAVLESKRAETALSKLKATAPSLISLADYHIQRQEMQKALEVVDRATELVSESPECHRKRGDLLQVLNRFKEASVEYEKVLQLDPADKKASANLDLSRQMMQSNDVQKLSSALWGQGRFSEACYVILPSATKQKPEIIKSALKWMLDGEKIQFRDVQVDDNICRLDLSNSNIRDLSPLKSMPLTHLDLTDCIDIYDLHPLQGMSLKELMNLKGYSRISDLLPADLLLLKNMPLKELNLHGCARITNLSPLQGMPLTKLDISDCANITDLGPLKNMRLTSLSLYGCVRTNNLSLVKNMPLSELDVTGWDEITDLAPLKGKRLTKLSLGGCTNIIDLIPLKGMPLTALSLTDCTGITDLSPLKGMPLEELDISGCINITDLHPLKGMHLKELNFNGCSGIVDFSPLSSMPIARFLGGRPSVSTIPGK